METSGLMPLSRSSAVLKVEDFSSDAKMDKQFRHLFPILVDVSFPLLSLSFSFRLNGMVWYDIKQGD